MKRTVRQECLKTSRKRISPSEECASILGWLLIDPPWPPHIGHMHPVSSSYHINYHINLNYIGEGLENHFDMCIPIIGPSDPGLLSALLLAQRRR